MPHSPRNTTDAGLRRATFHHAAVLLCAVAVLLALAGQARATFAQSNVFAFDTRDSISGHYAESGVFAFDTRAADGLSGRSASGSFSFDTRTLGAPTLVVSGSPHVNYVLPQQYQCTAYFPGYPPEDVTGRVTWSIDDGPPGTSVTRGLVRAGRGPGGVARITASLLPQSGWRRTSAPLEITIGPSVRVMILKPSPPPVIVSRDGQIFEWRVRAQAWTPHVGPSATWEWKWNNVPIPGADGASLDTIITGPAGTGELAVTLTDISAGAFGTGYYRLTLEKPPAGSEWSTRETSNSDRVEEGSYLNAQGGQVSLDPTRAMQGLIVLTHGLLLDENVEGQRTWLKEMAQYIDLRIVLERGAAKRPNVVIYDWLHDARATDDFTENEADQHVLAYMHDNGDGLVGPEDAQLIQRFYRWVLGTDPDSKAGKAANEAVRNIVSNGILSRNRGRAHGEKFLAKWILENKPVGGSGTPDPPVHLIGHSAGGFVIGECARQLKIGGYTGPILVTMLDTPFPWATHKAESGVRVERYISSTLGGGYCAQEWDADEPTYLPTDFGSGASYLEVVQHYEIEPSCDYHRYEIPDETIGPWTIEDDHANAHKWYQDTIQTIGEQNGFYHSPFLGGNPWACSSSGASSPSAPPPPALISLGPFQSYGAVTSSGGDYVLTEVDNAGIYIQTTLNAGASKLRFEYRFTTPGNGDFLQVFINGGIPLFVGSDTAAARAGFVSAEVDVSAYGGETIRLDLKLVSRGDPNAVLRLRNLQIEAENDLDGDGLSNATELANGTSPWLVDTDGDGFSDEYETLVAESDPTLADSDGDGADDLQEYLSGTDPVNAASVFRITDARWNAGGGLTLRWRGVLGQTYRVLRSATVDFASYDVIAPAVAASAPFTTYTDASVNPASTSQMFYRLALEQRLVARGVDGDFDGLGASQEIAAGSNSLLYDTDGDGLSDGEEVLVLHTSPIRTDSDGDGLGDWAEMIAGTNPANPASVLAITAIERNAAGNVVLRWSGVVGRTYRVLRSATPGFESYEVIASSWPGNPPVTTFIDASIGAASEGFYRVVVE